jgi:surface antigen
MHLSLDSAAYWTCRSTIRVRRSLLGASSGALVARSGCRPLPKLACVLIALMAGGCSLSYRLDSFWSKSTGEAETTGSIVARGISSKTSPSEQDLEVARAVARDAFARGGKDVSTSWENPRTGAHGTITSIASAYNQDGGTCRDFLASYVRGASESWLRGEACKSQNDVKKGTQKDIWEVRGLRPWKRT